MWRQKNWLTSTVRKGKQDAREKEDRQLFLKRSLNLFYSQRIVSLWHFLLDILLFLETWLTPQSHVYFSQAEGLHGGPSSASEEAREKKGDLYLLFTLISDPTFERSDQVRGRKSKREKIKE